jgi:methionyl-tRNA formyltransferase
VRFGYAASAPFGADVLERLAANHEIAFCLTLPDAPAGRGRGLRPTQAKLTALKLGIPVVESLEGTLDESTIVLVAYGRLIPRVLLDRHLWLNLHPSLLPRWRGAAPIERAIMAGDRETGVGIMRLEAGLDTGPVCLSQAIPIHDHDTFGTLAPRLEELAGTLLARALDEQPPFEPQPSDGVTYAEKITAADRTLDPDRPAAENERIVRALSPHIGARVALDDGTYLGVRRARVAEDGHLELLEVQPAGGRPMSWADYQRGRPDES